jgi:hypothetical protein
LEWRTATLNAPGFCEWDQEEGSRRRTRERDLTWEREEEEEEEEGEGLLVDAFALCS